MKGKFKWRITFFGFSPVNAAEDGTDATDVFPSFTSSIDLSTEVILIPFSFTVLELLIIVDETAFEEEEFLRTGLPG